MAFLILSLFASTAQKAVTRYKTDILQIVQVSPNAFVHISYLQTESFGKVGCNGMILRDGGEVIVMDTPANEADSKELLSYIEKELKCKTVGVVVTHFHEDCLGGLKEFHARQIPSYANMTTIDLARENKLTLPQNGFEQSLELKVGNKQVINEYLGQGHTVDNIVSYFPAEGVLFGGCLIKCIGASKGYLGDANIAEWPQTVEKVKARFEKATIIIPGHGESGGRDLLDFTAELFRAGT